MRSPNANNMHYENVFYKGLRMMKILFINGPNMQLLGKREPDVYGNESLEDVQKKIAEFAKSLNIETEFFQSNHEGDIVDQIGNAGDDITGIIINPAAYTHTSVAIHDALKGIAKPAIEIHLSNIHNREGFRQNSLTAPACVGQICGFGTQGYILALEAMAEINK